MNSRIEEPTQAKTLDEISNDNMIHYFKPELIKIEKGALVTDMLPVGVAKRFLEMGFFKRGIGYVLSDKAKDILQEIPA